MSISFRNLTLGGFQESLARSLDQNLNHLADPAQVILKADFILDGQQIVVAALLDFFGDIVRVQLVAFGPGARTVFENVAVLEAGPGHQISGSLTTFFPLPA